MRTDEPMSHKPSGYPPGDRGTGEWLDHRTAEESLDDVPNLCVG